VNQMPTFAVFLSQSSARSLEVWPQCYEPEVNGTIIIAILGTLNMACIFILSAIAQGLQA